MKWWRCTARQNPGRDLEEFRISGSVVSSSYPDSFRFYGGPWRDLLTALLGAGVRIPMFLFAVLETEFEKDRSLRLFMETGPGFQTLFVERKKLHRDIVIGRTEVPAKLSAAQVAAFTKAGMQVHNKYRVQIDL